MSKFRSRLKNFRAIHDADIIIDGITVLTGVNSSGKSTVSKFFYHFLKTNMNFDSIINRQFFRFMESISFDIRRVFSSLEDNSIHDESFLRSSFHKIFRRHRTSGELERSEIDNLDSTIATFKKDISEILNSLGQLRLNLSGIKRILLGEASTEEEYNDISSKLESLNKNEIFQRIFDLIDIKNDHRKQLIKNRAKKELLAHVNRDFNNIDNTSDYEYDLFMDNISLIRNDSVEDIGKFDIVYIEPTHNIEETPFEDDNLEEYLRTQKTGNFFNKKINDFFISKNLLDGDIDSTDTGIMYRQGNKSFPIENCASGVNSIASLYLLYKNGYINKDSIIIIDEPEVHLHPQWIVEYAHLIVLLRRELKATFLIASHSPDMISALKYISMKEKVNNNVNFYVSEPVKGKEGKYNFIHKKQDIEDIYASFNLSMDRISEYSGDANEE